MIKHYKSWSALNKQLKELLCDELKDRITYFYTTYHKPHRAYSRAAIRLDDKELVGFSWVNEYLQHDDWCKIWEETGRKDFDDSELKDKWNENAIYSDSEFLFAVTEFLNKPIEEALNSNDSIVQILAILDRRVGKRTLQKIKEEKVYLSFPDWKKQFYELRLASIA